MLHQSDNLPPPLSFTFSDFANRGEFPNWFSEAIPPFSLSFSSFPPRSNLDFIQTMPETTLLSEAPPSKLIRHRLRSTTGMPIEILDEVLSPERLPLPIS